MIVIFHSEAVEELAVAAAHYETEREFLGERFLATVRDAVSRIRAYPHMFRELEPGIRKCKIPRFPYGLIYREHSDNIEVLAVMHLHRASGYWRPRAQ